MKRSGSHRADLAAVALLIWLGVHSIRIYLAMVGWVLGGPLSTGALGLVFLGLWAIGQFGRPIARTLGGERASIRLALLFGLLYTLYHALPGPVTSPLFGCLGLVAWLWLMPTALRQMSLTGGSDQIMPGILLGLAAQVSLQTMLHGLDLVSLLGFWPAVGSAVLASLLLLALGAGSAGQMATGDLYEPSADRTVSPGWRLIALGPYLALQLTLAANLGWVQSLSGLELQGAAALVLAGLMLGLYALSLRHTYPLRAIAGVAAVAILIQPTVLEGRAWLIPLLQALLAVATGPALASALPATKPRSDRIYLWWGVGSFLFVTLTLLFYVKHEWKLFWPVMAAGTVLPGLLSLGGPTQVHASPWRQPAAALLLLSLAGIGLSLRPHSTARPLNGPAPAELKVMTYNIHQGFDLHGVPSPEAIARVIETVSPDLVGLQEVGRGWNVTGGADLAAWLRWRFPQYHVLYGRTEGDLVGNLLMSRYPVAEAAWELYRMRAAPLQRGWVWARIPTVRGDLLLTNTHLSAYRGEETDRISQAETLLRFWGGRSRFVLVGDLNALPESPPMQILRRGGLVDLADRKGLGQQPTFPAGSPWRRLDYLWASGDVEVLQAEILPTTASDHRPVVVRLRLKP